MKLLLHTQTNKKVESYLANPGHGLALAGEEGAGKGYLAVYLASSLLDAQVDKIESNPYVMHLKAQQAGVGIEQIRELQKFLTLTVPGERKIRRVVIVEYLDQLGHEAQNALLKTLEEPPEDTALIVTFAKADRVLPTLHSRLQSINVLPVDPASASEYFKDKDINKQFLVSGGNVGLLSAMVEGDQEHVLVSGIDEAKRLLRMSRYERMLEVDKLSKSKNIEIPTLLDGLYRLLEAGYKQQLSKSIAKSEHIKMHRRMELVQEAICDIDAKVSTKLVISRLFYSL